MPAFEGFPGAAKGTAVPNLFFDTVLPRMESPAELLVFLWAARLSQEQKGEARCVTAEEIWAHAPARQTFESMAGGRDALDGALDACVRLGALIATRLSGPGAPVLVYFVNNPQSRRAITRARSGQLTLRAGATVTPWRPDDRPDIYRLYEEHIGTITPMVAERLASAADEYPEDWVVDAFREAAERNARSWRYIERILQSWASEGHGHEAAPRNTLEDLKRRYPG